MNLFVDIETIPDQRQGAVEAAVALVKAPANYKDADKISAYKLEQAQEAYAKTALDGGRGQIVSIACAIDDMEPVVFPGSDERANLSSFIRYVDKAVNQEGECLNYCLIGHNLLGFDLFRVRRRYCNASVNQLFCNGIINVPCLTFHQLAAELCGCVSKHRDIHLVNPDSECERETDRGGSPPRSRCHAVAISSRRRLLGHRLGIPAD